jgi:CheY-like chemotaxis protein
MSPHLLVVDDSKVIRDSIRVIFTTEGFAVDTAENGAEGLSLARSRRYNGIITDVFMPVMDGYEFINIYLITPTEPKKLVTHMKMLLGGEGE